MTLAVVSWRWEHPAESLAAHCFVQDKALCGWGTFTGRVGRGGVVKCPICVQRKAELERASTANLARLA